MNRVVGASSDSSSGDHGSVMELIPFLNLNAARLQQILQGQTCVCVYVCIYVVHIHSHTFTDTYPLHYSEGCVCWGGGWRGGGRERGGRRGTSLQSLQWLVQFPPLPPSLFPLPPLPPSLFPLPPLLPPSSPSLLSSTCSVMVTSFKDLKKHKLFNPIPPILHRVSSCPTQGGVVVGE